MGLPWWLNGKESTCQSRRHGFDPWARKLPHAVGQLSPWCHSYGSQRALKSVLRNERSHRKEKLTHCS